MTMSIVTDTAKKKIEQLIELGEKNKDEIYERVVDEFGLTMKDVKKLGRELREDWTKKVKVLEQNE